MPSRRWPTSRFAVLALAVLAVAPLGGCHRPQPEPAPAPAASPPAPPSTPAPLDRGHMIAAAASAAEAYALGRPNPEALAKLVGARFEVSLPFGCTGETPEADVGYQVDSRRKTLTLRARPETWTQTPWVRALVGTTPVEAIEGFWLRRPWISSDACPEIRAPAASAAAGPPAPETLGLARLFAPGASRLLRRGAKGYEVVRKAEPGQLRLQGFRLVLAGRIGDFGQGQPIRCHGDGADLRPVCLVAVEFDRVTFEDPVSGEVLADWPS